MDSDRIFLSERGRLVELSSRYRRRPLPLSPPLCPPDLSPPSTQGASLASLACLCVCRHFSRVDSLLGLPDDLGRLLFNAALAQRLFQPDLAPRSIRLFAEAFGNTFAAQLNLSGMDFRAYPFLSAVIPHLKAITSLTLDCCHLDASEGSFLSEVGRLPCLRHLSLRGNCLLDASLRTLSAPWRFRPKSCAIQSLDLRDNKYITSKGVSQLIEIPSLRRIIFTSSIDLEEDFPLTQCSKLRWRMSRSHHPTSQIDTNGWIKEVMASWRESGFLSSRELEPEAEGRVLVLEKAGEMKDCSNLTPLPKKKRLNAAEAADLALL